MLGYHPLHVVFGQVRVLRMRFGIGMNTDHTLEEVGQQFSVIPTGSTTAEGLDNQDFGSMIRHRNTP